MAKKKLANTETDKDVDEFINQIKLKRRREEAQVLISIFKKITGYQPKIWGVSIIGFGKYTYQRKNGDEYEWFHTGFSPSIKRISIYVMYDINNEKALLSQLGPHQTGKGCLYINRLDKINLKILESLIKKSDRWKRT